MDYMTYGGLILVGIVAGALGRTLYSVGADRNVDILPPRMLTKLRIPRDQKDYSHIFTIGNEERRIAKAKDMLAPIVERQKVCFATLESEQEKMLDLISEVTRIQERILDSDTEGVEETIILAELTPALKRMGVVLDNIAAELTGWQGLSNFVRFLNQVALGLDRKQTIENLVERVALVTELDTKMEVALKEGQKTLALSYSDHEKTFDKWVRKK